MTAPTSAADAKGEVMLELKDVHTSYGRVRALQGSNLVVNHGEVVTLIGSNGAGKTTTLKTITGLLHPRQGKVTFEGKDITEHAAARPGQAGHRPVAGGTAHLQPPDSAGEPQDGRLHAHRGRECRGVWNAH